jgi:hypothetical protein
MKKPFFKRVGILYVPVSLVGGLIALFTIAIIVHDFIFIDSHSHSVSDTYYGFLPYGGIYFLMYNWLASGLSK